MRYAAALLRAQLRKQSAAVAAARSAVGVPLCRQQLLSSQTSRIRCRSFSSVPPREGGYALYTWGQSDDGQLGYTLGKVSGPLSAFRVCVVHHSPTR
jgi:hypothetical protein